MDEPKKISLVIADDHEIYRDGLRVMLRKMKDVEVLEEAADGHELVKAVGKHQPNVVLTDIKMPRMDGIAATREILARNRDVAVIALSMFDEESLVLEMLEAGAKGYLLKNAHKNEIMQAIRVVNDGEHYYCTNTNLRLARLLTSIKVNEPDSPKVHFTEKELEVIWHTCEERSNKEIADLMMISHRTVEGYKQKILEKMNVKSSAGIVIYSIRNGLYKLKENK